MLLLLAIGLFSKASAYIVSFTNAAEAKYTESYRRRYKVGKTAFFDGFLRECEPGRVVINPSMSRDPSASFHPQR
ncbi:hypothetical protein OAE86_03275 [Akkermansiaceae bacterium]|nr:hypothetical protein [Akkermansiaceae bacterium]